MTSRPSTIVFDLGNVLLDWNPRYLYRKMFSCEEDIERFLVEIEAMAWIRELDRGLPIKAAVEELSSRFPHYTDCIAAFDARWAETLPNAIAGTERLLEALHAEGAPLYALTNFSAEKYEETTTRFAFFERFNGVVVSGREGLLKPDAAIYRLLLDRYELNAQDCLFIDDVAANVAGARAVGMQAVRFESPEQLQRALQDYGWLQDDGWLTAAPAISS